MKRVIISVLLSLCCTFTAFAQQYNKYSESYNYRKAMEALNAQDEDTAKGSLKKEISEHHDNGYAYLFLAAIYLSNDEYGLALTNVDLSIKYLPKKDKEYRSFAYYKRAGVHRAMDNDDLAIADYTTSIALDPNDTDTYSERAQIYYEQKRYDLADQDYAQIQKIEPNGVMAYMGMGRNAIAREQYDKAIELFDYVIALYPDYSSGYSFRAEAYYKRERYSEAASDVVKALSIDGDNKAFYLMSQLASSSFVHINLKLKAQAVLESNSYYWPYCLGIINEDTNKFAEAVEYYQKSAKLDMDDVIMKRISNCYEEMGEWDLALEYIEKAINLDSEDRSYVLSKADILFDAGRIEDAISVLDDFISKTPDYFYGYYRRGWFKDNLKDVDGAIDDYTVCIDLEPDYAYALMSRGKNYMDKKETELARKDFEAVLQKDTIPEMGSSRHYALFYLGRVDDAKEWMNEIISAEPEEAGHYYDAACLYSLMGELDKSVDFLGTAFEKGYNRYHHVMTDSDLDNIRGLESYKQLMEDFAPSNVDMEKGDLSEANTNYIEKVVEVPFTRSGGVTKVKCAINGLPLHFVFDTGAADVTISRVEATFMFKNDYLTAADVIGKSRYMDANGDISVGTVINLKNVTFGGLELENVRASVVDSNSAPLLLGQSVLSRLGKVEIDYEKSVLRIVMKEKRLL